MSECLKYQELLLDYDEGDLADADKALVDSHLRSCPSCTQFLQELRDSWNALSSWPALEPASDYKASFWLRVGKESKLSGRSVLMLLKQHFWIPATAAAMLACAFYGGVLFNSPELNSYADSSGANSSFAQKSSKAEPFYVEYGYYKQPSSSSSSNNGSSYPDVASGLPYREYARTNTSQPQVYGPGSINPGYSQSVPAATFCSADYAVEEDVLSPELLEEALNRVPST